MVKILNGIVTSINIITSFTQSTAVKVSINNTEIFNSSVTTSDNILDIPELVVNKITPIDISYGSESLKSYILNTGNEIILFDKYLIYKELTADYTVTCPIFTGEYCDVIYSNGTEYGIKIDDIKYTNGKIIPIIIASNDTIIGGFGAYK